MRIAHVNDPGRLHSELTWARCQGHILASPAIDIKIAIPQKEIKLFTPARDSAQAFLFAYACGVRSVDIKTFTLGQLGKLTADGRYVPNPVTTFVQHKTNLLGRVVLNETSRAILLG